MLSLFSFFKKSPTIGAFQQLEVDMHSHLIPGIDDGSPDIPTSLALIQGLQSLGYKKLITTPHVLTDLYPNNSRKIKKGYTLLKNAMAEAKLTIPLEVAAEYFVDLSFVNLVEAHDILSFGTRRFVLIEMSFVSGSPNLEDAIFSLTARGYQPILAHPERYTYLINRLHFFKRLQSLGCMMQINILSLTGYYGRGIQQWATTLLKSDLINFLGTDLHHAQHLDLLNYYKFDKKLGDVVSKYPFQNSLLL